MRIFRHWSDIIGHKPIKAVDHKESNYTELWEHLTNLDWSEWTSFDASWTLRPQCLMIQVMGLFDLLAPATQLACPAEFSNWNCLWLCWIIFFRSKRKPVLTIVACHWYCCAMLIPQVDTDHTSVVFSFLSWHTNINLNFFPSPSFFILVVSHQSSDFYVGMFPRTGVEIIDIYTTWWTNDRQHHVSMGTSLKRPWFCKLSSHHPNKNLRCQFRSNPDFSSGHVSQVDPQRDFDKEFSVSTAEITHRCDKDCTDCNQCQFHEWTEIDHFELSFVRLELRNRFAIIRHISIKSTEPNRAQTHALSFPQTSTKPLTLYSCVCPDTTLFLKKKLSAKLVSGSGKKITRKYILFRQ